MKDERKGSEKDVDTREELDEETTDVARPEVDSKDENSAGMEDSLSDTTAQAGEKQVKKVKRVKKIRVVKKVKKVPKKDQADRTGVDSSVVAGVDSGSDSLVKDLGGEVKHLEKSKGMEVEQSKERQVKETKESSDDKREGSFFGFVLELMLISLLVIVISSLVNKYVVSFNIVSGSSMNPTLKDGDVCSVVKTRFSGDIERGDIISFRLGGESGDSVYVKRVIGLPGDRVNVYDGVIHINGEPLDETYIHEGVKTDNPEKLYWELGDGEYFVLGDNRKPGMSYDSRHYGAIHYTNIEGKLGMVVMPFERQMRLDE